ncbi:MAG: extracellular solute-binding protein [Lachnospiraceae bacterium]|nr:extracellular solute-binding protein [Lachnospiraceae bacterium]
MKKELVSLVLTAAMVVSLAACGQSTATGQSEAPKAEESATEEASAKESEEVKEEATEEAGESGASNDGSREDVTFMVIDLYAGQANTGDHAQEILDKINDYCNVNLNIDWVLNDSLEERGTLALASPDTMPMIMTWGGSTISSPVASAARDGAFVNLNDYIWDEEKYPNLSKLNKNVAGALNINGELFAIPRGRELGRYGISYRKDWADKLGIAEPKTPEDVFNMIHAFTYEDPDGNGKDDTIGMEMTSYTGPFDIIQSWFGVGTGWALEDGKLIPAHMQAEYKEAMDYIKKIYDDGGMPANWAEIPTDTWAEGCKTGKCGVYIDVMDGGRRIWDYFVDNEVPSVDKEGEWASMELLGPINGKTPCLNVFNGYYTLSTTTCDTPEKIEACLRLLDRLNDNDMRLLVEYGIEGVNWERDASDPNIMVRLDQEESEEAKALAANYSGLNQMLAYIPTYDPQPNAAITERVEAQREAYVRNREAAVFNPAQVLLSSSDTYQANGSVIDSYITTARSQYITGAITWEDFEKEMQRWLDEGGQQIIDEVNALYVK